MIPNLLMEINQKPILERKMQSVKYITYYHFDVMLPTKKSPTFVQKIIMKNLRGIFKIVIFSFILFGLSSCYVTSRRDNGNNRGWFNKYHNHRHHDKRVYVIEKNNSGKHNSSHNKKIKVRKNDKWGSKR